MSNLHRKVNTALVYCCMYICLRRSTVFWKLQLTNFAKMSSSKDQTVPLGDLMVFEHILIASGGAQHSLRAETKAVELAKPLEAKLSILSVIRVTNSMRTFGEAYELERERHEAILQEAMRRCEKRGLTPQTLLKTGSVEHAIIETADEINCDLIVVGRRNLSLIGAAMLGSVSDFVIRHARCAVLVVS